MIEELVGMVFRDLDFAHDCNRFVVIDKDREDLLTCNNLGELRRITLADLGERRYKVLRVPKVPQYANP